MSHKVNDSSSQMNRLFSAMGEFSDIDKDLIILQKTTLDNRETIDKNYESMTNRIREVY